LKKINGQFTLALLLGFMGVVQVSAQTDSLILNNGDVIVGKIKNLNKGVIQIETDYSDSDFKIEWDQVSEIYSPRTYQITLSDGTRLKMPINSTLNNPKRIIIGGDTTSMIIDLMDLVYINPIEKNFISRLSAAVSIGYNFTASNNLSQFSSRISLGFLADYWSLDGSLDIVKSTQDDAENVSRTDGLITFRYFLENDWYLMAQSDFLSNDEQKLKLRAAFSTGIGKLLVHSNKMILGFSGGGVWNNEVFTDETVEDKRSVEAFLGSQLDIFDIGDLNLFTSLTVYPGITESGRIRADFKFDLKYDLFLDFYINVG